MKEPTPTETFWDTLRAVSIPAFLIGIIASLAWELWTQREVILESRTMQYDMVYQNKEADPMISPHLLVSQ